MPIATQTDAVAWLMDGDPAIRWQTQRDLLDAPAKVWQPERQRTLTEGWGAQLLALQAKDGGWGGGMYAPKWTSTTYTLLDLCEIGIPSDCAAAQRGASLVIDRLLGPTCDDDFAKHLSDMDRCIVGMMLQIGAYFQIADARIEAIVDNVLSERMPDGGWNCRRHRKPYPHHSSFNTTFNVLDGVREYLEQAKPNKHNASHRKALAAAEQSALELLLQHHLFRSDHTGKVINPKFPLLSHPHRWHYDVLRALDYFARISAPHDPRLQEGIDLLRASQRPDGLWAIQQVYSGKVHFNMETKTKPSRWNTLRALRVLRWWDGG